MLQPGLFTTVQDLGRPGHSAIGVPRGGAIDPLALQLGNRLLANDQHAAALEMTLVGGAFEFTSSAQVVLTGADSGAQLLTRQGVVAVPPAVPITIGPADQLRCGPITRGVRSYLCIRGGIAVPAVLGSRSTLPAAGFGGFNGRPLLTGDLVEYADPAASSPNATPRPPHAASHLSALAAALALELTGRRSLRVLPGAHADRFDPTSLAAFYAGEYTVTPRSDRAGIRLDGPAINSPGDGRLTSEGMMPGAVQVPSGGQPIILAPDGPTTGGYPVIAAIITADLPVLGQLRPLTKIRFEPVTRAQARDLFLRQHERLLGNPASP